MPGPRERPRRSGRHEDGRVLRTGAGIVGVVCAAAVAVGACSPSDEILATRSADAATTAPSTTGAVRSSTTSTSTTTTTATTTTTTTTTAPPSTTASMIDRDHVLTGYAPYAVAADITLHHPAAVVELIGLHQSNHEGALDQQPVEGTSWAVELGGRGRGTGPRTAADIVARPDEEIRSPVTGVVDRAAAYVLYCNISDEYVVVVPDDAPHLEVKLLHVEGLTVAAGDRVVAGETVLAARAHQLPFESQVDRRTAAPSWPHVHVEVVDPSIPNVPNGGTGSEEC